MKTVEPPDAQRVLVLMNPKSGSTDRQALVHELCEFLEQGGLTTERLTDIDALVQTVEQAGQSQAIRCVVAAGGDGTVSLLANRLPPQTPLAILPLGTENLLAKHLGYRTHPRQVADVILNNRRARLDAGRANGQLFLVMASVGFDADVVHRLHATRSGHIHHWSYAKPIWNAIWEYQYPEVRIRVDDGEDTPLISRWAFVFNVPRYAMNLPILPEAQPDDGQLDLCTFRNGSLARGLYYLSTVVMRLHQALTSSRRTSFRKLRMEADEPVPYQLDGDPGGTLPLEIEVLPKFLHLIVPADYA